MERGVTMAVKLTELGTRRFIGDAETMIVHDRWNTVCEGCLVDILVENGTARGFNPDQSDQAFWEDYEYCPHCFDRSDPPPPTWAVKPEGSSMDEGSSGAPEAGSPTGERETISTGTNGSTPEE